MIMQALVWTTAWMPMHELQMGLSRACIDFLQAGYLVDTGMHTWLMYGYPKMCMRLLKCVCFEKVQLNFVIGRLRTALDKKPFEHWKLISCPPT